MASIVFWLPQCIIYQSLLYYVDYLVDIEVN